MTTDRDEALKRLRRKRASKARVRPSRKAKARNATRQARPIPKPAGTHRISRRVPKAPAGMSEEMKTQLSQLRSEFSTLEDAAQLSDVYQSIGDMDAKLMELPITLESLRDRGYVHGGNLEDRLEAIDDSWDDARPRVEKALEKYIKQLDSEADRLERRLDRTSFNQTTLDSLEKTVNSLSSRIDSSRSSITGLYDGLESDLSGAAWDIGLVIKMMDLIDGSSDIRLRETEGPLLAVKTEWHRDGKEGPDGFLFLTDQRFLFEQREEVVTKKRFGLFKADSKHIQELLLDIPVQDIEGIKHKEEGGVFGMGKKDILELVFAGSAPVSRGRFHLKGQDSSDWAAMIKKAQTGELDDDRADEYVDEMEEAAATAVAFPTQCPGCYAPVPTPPRGVNSVTCEFCGSVVTPNS